MTNKYDFTFFIQATNCNPNGDPDMGNLPRIDEETMHGFITDVCIKRNIRNYIETAFQNVDGMDIIIKDATNVNQSIAEAVIEINNGKVDKKKGNPKVNESRQLVCEKYFDARAFGAVLTTGLNAGQIQGPIQFGFGSSVDPIFVKDITITRNCYAEGDYNTVEEYQKKAESIPQEKKRTMGRKQFIPYGLYVVHGHVSAHDAQKTGFSEKDLQYLFESILNMYNSSTSASKAGMTVVSPIIIFKHVGSSHGTPEEKQRGAVLGCAPAYRLQELIDIHKKEDVEFPRNYTDYNLSVNISNLPDGVEIGFKYNPFEPIVWGKPNDNWIKVC